MKTEPIQIIHQFCQYIQAGETLLLTGAGISNSHPSHLPLAIQIIEEVLRNLYRNSELLQIFKKYKIHNEDDFLLLFKKNLFKELRFETLMQLIYDTTGKLDLLKIFDSIKFNPNHKFLAETLKIGNQVITTNFDRLIETVFRDEIIEIISTEKEFKNIKGNLQDSKFLFKIHGTIEREDSIKATLNQIGKAGLAFMWEPAKGDVLERLTKNKHLVVLGYSGSDDFDITSKLAIIESEKEILWIHHKENTSLQIIPIENYLKEFKDQLLATFFKKRHATVISGNTSTIIHEFATKALKMRIKIPKKTCNCNHKNKYIASIATMFRSLKNEESQLVNFLIGRLLYTTHQREMSLHFFLHLEDIFRQTMDVDNYARTLLNIAVIKDDLGDLKGAIKYQELSNLFLISHGDIVTLADSLSNLGVLKMRERNFVEAEKHLRQAASISQKNKLDNQYAKSAANLGSLYWTIGQYNEAKKWLRYAFKKYKKLGDHSGCATVLSTWGKIVYVQDDDHETAVILFRMAMEHAIRLHDIDMESKIWNNLAGIYRRQAKIEDAYKAYEKAISLAKQAGNNQSVVISKMGLVAVELSRGNTNAAVQNGKECFEAGEKMGLLDHVAQTAGNIGLALLDCKQFKQALKYLEMAKKDFEALNLPNEIAFTYRNIGECFLGLEKRDKAIKMFEKAVQIYSQYDLDLHANEVKKLIKEESNNT